MSKKSVADLQKLVHAEEDVITERYAKIAKLQRLNQESEEHIRKWKKTIDTLPVTRGFVVSDHALVRYMERVMGYDMNQVRNLILTDEVKSFIKAGACTIKKDGYTLRVVDNTIVTVVT